MWFLPPQSLVTPTNWSKSDDFRNPNWPINPIVGDLHEVWGRTYIWTGTIWARTYLVLGGGGGGSPSDPSAVSVFTYSFHDGLVDETFTVAHNQGRVPSSIMVYDNEGEVVLTGVDTTLNTVTISLQDFIPLIGNWLLVLTFELHV